jgi:hypothetical protein
MDGVKLRETLTSNLNATNYLVRHLAIHRLDCVFNSFGGCFPGG